MRGSVECLSLDQKKIKLIFDCSGEELRETRPLSFLATDEDGRIYSNLSCQTDPDPLNEDVKIVGLDLWQGEGLAAVEQIDNVRYAIITCVI
ncbi:unnamed protein product [Anisakis simplex]|uniref:MMS1_N domain-containing protein n=1 Tax=Anisakis simplex TaxID=6269 RepID=A0A0M3JH30_ANISI|nr:unnamed protein product [Anisakis simplex]